MLLHLSVSKHDTIIQTQKCEPCQLNKLSGHTNFPAHDDGHTLDLLITRSSSTVITHLSHHESYQSDHKSFTFKFFPHIRPSTERTTIQYCSYNTIDVDNFKSDILASPLYTNPASNDQCIRPSQINFPPPSDPFSTSMPQSKPKTVVQRPHTPWINPRNSPSQAGTWST